MSKASPDEIVDEIEEIRLRLAATIDELIVRTNPKNIARRQVEKTKAHFVDPEGNIRFENVVPVVVSTTGVIAGILVLRRLLR